MGVRCFWCAPTDQARFSMVVGHSCGHEAVVTELVQARAEHMDWDKLVWPATCAGCGEALDFTDGITSRHTTYAPLYERSDNREQGQLQEFGPGAMWDATWMPDAYRGADGRCITVTLPNGHDWMVDSQASNCTRPDEDHDCWCRHGVPPHLTVDKSPEPGRSTCDAGAGSIFVGEGTPQAWHGFLRDGELVT